MRIAMSSGVGVEFYVITKPSTGAARLHSSIDPNALFECGPCSVKIVRRNSRILVRS
jgi:hypothetical protein